jgi:NAD(P)-dependent dehydrogenase (short-subunit alcohol dehydrogenase family)
MESISSAMMCDDHWLRRQTPLFPGGYEPDGRIGQPDDIASTVAFLAGPDGGWVNGQIIRANGGVI